MTDLWTDYHPLTQRARTLGNRSRHAPLIATPDSRPSDWLALVRMLAVFAFGFFTLGLAGWLAWVLLP